MSVLHSVISLSLIVSPFILLLLLTVPLTDKRYNPGGRCFIWLLLMVAMCVPLITVIPKPAFQINMPVAVIGKPVVSVGGNSAVDTLQDNKTVDGYLTEASIVPESINQMILPDTMVSVTGNAPDNKNIAAILEAIAAHLPMLLYVLWLSGALVFLSLRLGSYFILRRSIRRWSTHVTDEYILKMFDEIRASLLVHGSPSLLFCKKIASPMLMGYIKPLVLLPAVEYQPDELALLLRHELAHYKRRDLWFKLALVVVTSVYWFNPLVHLMAAQAGKDLEAACDDLTVNGMDILLRKRYSEIILNAACKPQLHPHPMTTHFFGGKYMLKKRFANILGRAKKKGTALFVVTGAVVLIVTLMVGFDFAEAKTLSDSTLPSFSNENENQTNKMFDVNDKEMYTEKMQEYVDNWNAYAAQIERSKAWMDELYCLYKAKDWEAYEVKLKEYRAWMEESFDSFDWSAYSSQSDDVFFSLPPEGDWDFFDWDAYTAQMEDYDLQMEDFQRQMEEMFNSMEEFQAIDWGSVGTAKVYTLDELSALVYNQSKPMECQFDNVTSLKLLGLTSENIKVTRGGDMLTIRYPEWYEGEYAFTSENDGKTVFMNKETEGRYLKQGNGFSGGWLPEVLRHKGLQAEIVIEIIIPESMSLESLYVGSVASKVEIKDCTLGKFSLNTVSSPVMIQNCSFDSVNISTVDGETEVQLIDKASDYDIVFNGVSGNLKVNGTDVKSARNKSAEKKITFSCVSGSMAVTDGK